MRRSGAHGTNSSSRSDGAIVLLRQGVVKDTPVPCARATTRPRWTRAGTDARFDQGPLCVAGPHEHWAFAIWIDL